jgi:hypothetical protein
MAFDIFIGAFLSPVFSAIVRGNKIHFKISLERSQWLAASIGDLPEALRNSLV